MSSPPEQTLTVLLAVNGSIYRADITLDPVIEGAGTYYGFDVIESDDLEPTGTEYFWVPCGTTQDEENLLQEWLEEDE